MATRRKRRKSPYSYGTPSSRYERGHQDLRRGLALLGGSLEGRDLTVNQATRLAVAAGIRYRMAKRGHVGTAAEIKRKTSSRVRALRSRGANANTTFAAKAKDVPVARTWRRIPGGSIETRYGKSRTYTAKAAAGRMARARAIHKRRGDYSTAYVV